MASTGIRYTRRPDGAWVDKGDVWDTVVTKNSYNKELYAELEGTREALRIHVTKQQTTAAVPSASQRYEEKFYQEYIPAKYAQAGRVASKLDEAIALQQTRLECVRASEPGFFSLPATRRDWQAKNTAEENRLKALNGRSWTVEKIRRETHYFSPSRIEPMLDKLAEDKLQREEPELTADRNKERHTEQVQANQAQEARREAERAAHRQGRGPRIG